MLPVLTVPKSNLLETILSAFPPLPLPDNFLFRLFGPAAFTPGPDELASTFPSNSSNGLEDCVDGGFGSFEGLVGYGSAKKYAWFRAYGTGPMSQNSSGPGSSQPTSFALILLRGS